MEFPPRCFAERTPRNGYSNKREKELCSTIPDGGLCENRVRVRARAREFHLYSIFTANFARGKILLMQCKRTKVYQLYAKAGTRVPVKGKREKKNGNKRVTREAAGSTYLGAATEVGSACGGFCGALYVDIDFR